MDFFLSIVNPRGEHDRLALDLETTQGLSKAYITDFINDCLEYVRQETGRYPILYSRKSWLDPNVDMRQLPPDLDLWIARYLPQNGQKYAPEYPPPPPLPLYTSRWLIHQTGDKLPPIGCQSKTMDYDRWNGEHADVLHYFGYADGETPQPPEPPAPPDNPVLFRGRVTATPYLNIRAYPTVLSADLGDLYEGTELDIYEVSANGWYRIVEGWVMGAYVERIWDGAVLDVPLYSQKDARWAFEKLGTSASTIGGYGCLLTCAAMNCLYFGKLTNPHMLNQAMVRVNGYANGNLWKWWSLPLVYPDLEVRDWVNCEKVPAPLERIDNALAAGNPVIVMVDYRPGGTIQMHFVLIVGKSGDDYVINDPIDGKQVSFRSRYGDPVSGIYRIAVYARRGQ